MVWTRFSWNLFLLFNHKSKNNVIRWYRERYSMFLSSINNCCIDSTKIWLPICTNNTFVFIPGQVKIKTLTNNHASLCFTNEIRFQWRSVRIILTPSVNNRGRQLQRSSWIKNKCKRFEWRPCHRRTSATAAWSPR